MKTRGDYLKEAASCDLTTIANLLEEKDRLQAIETVIDESFGKCVLLRRMANTGKWSGWVWEVADEKGGFDSEPILYSRTVSGIIVGLSKELEKL